MSHSSSPRILPSILSVKAIPKAKQERIKEETIADGTTFYKIYVTAAPENGKANEAVIKLLAKHLKIAPSHLTLIQGHTSSYKKIKIDG